jgi:short-subunit dehydrogenase
MTYFDEKVIWITGASSGIGEALVYAFAKTNAKLVLSSRKIHDLERVLNSAKVNVERVLLLPMDLEHFENMNDFANKVIDKFERIDVLINNAGLSQRGLAKNTHVSIDERLMKVNYFGTIALTKTVLPLMMDQGFGTIATVTSAVGKFGSPWRSGYAASKHALHGFFDSLRAEIFENNIKVLLICPGFVNTNVSINALDETGNPLNIMDSATENGLDPNYVAKKILKAISEGKEEIFIGGFKEYLGLLMKRFFPTLFSIMVRKMAVR